jgi:radical SAM superfamily enzyme YgiQ (UPF0313 family)
VSDILFLTSAAPEKSPFSTTEKRPPLGLGTLMSIARGMGHSVHFIDRYLSGDAKDLESYVRDYNVEWVAIYSNTICSRDTISVLERLSSIRNRGDWNGRMMVGGPHTSVDPGALDKADHIVTGEGEKAMTGILEGRVTEKLVPGTRLSSEELNDLPFQPWDVFTRMPYDYTCPWMESAPVFTMNTSRGCPFNCSFCSVGSVWGREYTRFNSKRIIDEIEHLVERYGARGIYFREDNFTIDHRRVNSFCRGMRERKVGVEWACETRVDNLNENMMKRMSSAGCRALYLGVESGSQKILDALNKRINLDQVRNVVRWGKENGIKSYCSLITGVPGETIEDYRKTMRLMRELRPHDYAFNVFVGIPYSDLYRKIVDEGLVEHIDDVGLAYLPGFDVKVRFFYGKSSKNLVDHTFDESRRSVFDRALKRKLIFRPVERILERLRQARDGT